MELENLKKGVELHNRIQQLEAALKCFQFPDGESRKPTLIIEHLDDDYEGRINTRLPFTLSNELISLLNAEITKAKIQAESELKAL